MSMMAAIATVVSTVPGSEVLLGTHFMIGQLTCILPPVLTDEYCNVRMTGIEAADLPPL